MTATAYAKFFGLKRAKNMNDWCGGVTTFNKVVHLPVLIYNDPREKIRSANSATNTSNSFSAPCRPEQSK